MVDIVAIVLAIDIHNAARKVLCKFRAKHGAIKIQEGGKRRKIVRSRCRSKVRSFLHDLRAHL